METIILFLGFAGAWLLFAGPIYQAAQELMEEDIREDSRIERFADIKNNIKDLPKVSAYWWFLPPVKMYLEHKRSAAYRKRFIESMQPGDVEAMRSFMNTATGWLMVAAGGFLIATKETYELCLHYEIHSFYSASIVILMAFLSVLYTVVRIKQTVRGKK